MNAWKRIIFFFFVLLGGTITFAFWSFQQFDNAFEDLSASCIAMFPLVREIPSTPEASSTTFSGQEGIDSTF